MAEERAIIIRGGRVVDVDRPEAGAADILVRGDAIVEVGPPGLAAPEGAAEIDAAGFLLHPGLVNAHTHAYGSLGKGFGDRWTLELLLTAAPWLGGNRTLEDKALSTRLGALEMVLKGTTACYDLYLDLLVPQPETLNAIAGAYAEVGMRAVAAPMIADRTFYEAIPGLMDALTPALRKEIEPFSMAEGTTTLEAMARTLSEARLDGTLVRPAVAPTIPLHCSDDFMLGCARLAEEHGTGLHSHTSESKIQAVSALRRYNGTIAAHLDRLGVLGPRFVAAHGVWLDEDDMKRLADNGASVAHNPGSNMRLGSGIADARAMLEQGVNVGVGTDGPQCSDNLNMYEAMRMASLVSKARGPDYERWLTTREVFAAATVGSARALGLEGQIGRLAPGFKADIVFLDLGHINWIPFNDAINQIVHTEDGTAVRHVMIGGRMVVEDRRVTTLDMAGLAAQVEAVRARHAELSQDAKALVERLSPVVGAFCKGLAQTPYHIHRYAAPADA